MALGLLFCCFWANRSTTISGFLGGGGIRYPCPNPNRTNATATPTFRNILYEDIVLRRGGLQMSIQGLPESPIEGVRFRNVTFAETVGAPPPYHNGSIWGACENVRGRCDRATPTGSCPPCFHHDKAEQTVTIPVLDGTDGHALK